MTIKQQLDQLDTKWSHEIEQNYRRATSADVLESVTVRLTVKGATRSGVARVLSKHRVQEAIDAAFERAAALFLG